MLFIGVAMAPWRSRAAHRPALGPAERVLTASDRE
jgi:hypothetical protein